MGWDTEDGRVQGGQQTLGGFCITSLLSVFISFSLLIAVSARLTNRKTISQNGFMP